MYRLFLALLVFLAVGPVRGTQLRFPEPDVRSQQITAHRVAPPARAGGMLRFVRGWHLVSPNDAFGGFSGLALTGPGHFQLVGDNGYVTRFGLGADGAVFGGRIAMLPVPAGGAQRKSQRDVESMTFDPASGKTWVALEGLNQIWRLDAALRRIETRARLPGPPWPSESGPEAMVRLADGRTILFSENADTDPRGREALLFAGDPAEPGAKAIRFLYDSEGKGLVSDAAVLPDGRILLVHRRLGLQPVFTTILGIADPADIHPGGVIRAREIGRIPKSLAENYEGAAVEVRNGRSFLWLVSDHNFNRWQRSLLVEFELVGLPPPTADSKKAAR